MSVIQISKKPTHANNLALFNLGFRPFFLAASVFASISVLMWMAVYFGRISLPLRSLSTSQWHSHEMIYGYSVAVIAGFLLTAIMNWTGIQTIYGKSLIALFSIWLIARFLFLFGSKFLEIAAFADLLFMIALVANIVSPIFKARQWKQIGIVANVLLLMLGNLSFYLGAFGILESGVYWGIYGGLYVVIAQILTIGGRVFPAFIRNGVDYEVIIANPLWLTISSLFLFILFVANQLFTKDQVVLGYLSLALFLVNSVRLLLWYTSGIWRKPLLWSLYLSFVFITLGFLLFALSAFWGLPRFLAVHAFAFGGIGLATMGMMSRVVLGHTGRNIRTPPTITTYALIILTIGAILRVILPLFDQIHYSYWIFFSQLLWIIAFSLFFITYSSMLLQPRVDGKLG